MHQGPGHVWLTASGIEIVEEETTGGDRHEHHIWEEKTDMKLELNSTARVECGA